MYFTKPAISFAMATALTVLCLHQAQAKIPPASPEAQAKKAETMAKTAFGDKVSAYKLCLAQDRVVAAYLKTRAATATSGQPVPGLPACQDPGAYVPMVPAVAAVPAAPAATPATPAIAGAAPVAKEAVKK